MKAILIAALAALSIFSAPAALAGTHKGPQDDVLCSSNMAYRLGHKDHCGGIGINSHGGGGGPAPIGTSDKGGDDDCPETGTDPGPKVS